MERTDSELIEAACQGEVESLRTLYERHYLLVLGIARSCLSDIHLAEDAAQETFAVACRRLATLRKTDRFPEWLGTICRRTASRMARARRKESPANLKISGGPQLEDLSVPATPESHAEERVKRVRRAVEQLPEAAREIIWLHYYSRLSYEQIAQSLNISLQSVQGRLRRARWLLAESLARNDEERSHVR